MTPSGNADTVRLIRCECDSAAEFTLTMSESTSHDATSFCCYACLLVVLEDWGSNEHPEHWSDVPGWTIERMRHNDDPHPPAGTPTT